MMRPKKELIAKQKSILATVANTYKLFVFSMVVAID